MSENKQVEEHKFSVWPRRRKSLPTPGINGWGSGDASWSLNLQTYETVLNVSERYCPLQINDFAAHALDNFAVKYR